MCKMSSPTLEEEGVLREWAPLSKLLQQIPMRLRQGMFFEDVKFTCVDATIECIVLGTNCGTVFWYDRSSHYVQQLRLEKGGSITSVKVVSTVDYMVAAGDNSGIVSIFKIPRIFDGNEIFISNLAEKIERYTVGGLHKTKVTALDWSKNGQKLFSGDSEGIVVFTEMDFALNLSKAREIVNEKYPIVQLSYHQREQVLLISSELRCIIWSGQSSSGSSVTQVGQKERSSMMPLGGTFVCDDSGDIYIFSCRSGLKLWKADLMGHVKFTFLFKDALKKCKNSVKLLKAVEPLNKDTKMYEFGKLYSWRDGLFLSYTKHNLYIIDPTQVTVVSTLLNVKHIVCVCTTRTEVFVIAGKRDLIRLSYTPDLYDSSLGGFGNMVKADSVSSLPAVSLQPVIGSPLTSTSFTKNTFLSASTANSEPSSSEVIYGQDPAALPPVVSIHDGVPELRIDPSKYQQYTTIGQQGFDDIIYTQKRSVKHKNKSRRRSAEILEAKPKSLGISFDEVTTYLNKMGNFLNGEFTSPVCDGELVDCKLEEVIPASILPDLRDIDVIAEDVAKKEALLDAMLESSFKPKEADVEDSESKNIEIDLHSVPSMESSSGTPPLPVNISPPMESSMGNDVETNSRRIFEIEMDSPENVDDTVINRFEESENVTKLPLNSFPNPEINKEENPLDSVSNHSSPDNFEPKDNNNDINLTPNYHNGSTTLEQENVVSLFENGDQNFTDIPLDSSDPLEENGHSSFMTEANSSELDFDINETLSSECIPTEMYASINDWFTLSCPVQPVFMSSWNEELLICCPQLKVYASTNNTWYPLKYKAQYVIPSASGKFAVKIYCGLAHYSDKWMSGEEWKKLAANVQHAAVTDEEIWYIINGKLFCLKLSDGSVLPYECDVTLSRVYSFHSDLLTITESGRVLLYQDKSWKLIRGIQNVKCLAIGPQHLVWGVTFSNSVFITDKLKVEKPMWWQVPICNTKNDVIISMCATNEGIFLAYSNSTKLMFNKLCVSGHRWTPAPLNLTCHQISAGGVFEEKGCIWVLINNNKLLALDSSLRILKELLPPCKVVCLASTPGALWLLSDDGSVYLRQGITDSNPLGIQWRKLDLEQLYSHIEIVGISCGTDVVWACDIRGKVIMLVGSPHSIANDTFMPAWVNVDGKPLDNNTFTKVYVGPETYMVWALDNAGNIYVREAVFPTYPPGTGWVHVPYIKASHLTISSEAVYALNSEGVYKRIGISQSNYIGDDWIYIPVKLNYITASFDLGLFGICSKTGNLVSHIEREFPLSDLMTVEKDWALL